MYMYMYIYVYVHVHIHVHVHICICTCTYTCICTCTYTCTYTIIHVCMYMWPNLGKPHVVIKNFKWMVAYMWLSCDYFVHVCVCDTYQWRHLYRGYLGPGGLSDSSSHINCTGGAAGYIDRKILTVNHIYGHPTCKVSDPFKICTCTCLLCLCVYSFWLIYVLLVDCQLIVDNEWSYVLFEQIWMMSQIWPRQMSI